LTSLRALLERVLGAHGIRYELVEAGNAQELRTERMRVTFIEDGRFSITFSDGTELRGTGLVVNEETATVKVAERGLNFDYAHFLPHIEKCSTLHGHTASVSVEVTGPKNAEGYVVDFSLLKSAVKSAIDELDHKLIVSRRYIAEFRDGRYHVTFEGLGGSYDLWVPQSRVAVIEGDSTAENIAAHIARRVLDYLSVRPVVVRVSVSEGIGKYAVAELLG
jgi:6-pyruvoyltetrahydropterin/6-carboxytetrahydropterin synthase